MKRLALFFCWIVFASSSRFRFALASAHRRPPAKTDAAGSSRQRSEPHSDQPRRHLARHRRSLRRRPALALLRKPQSEKQTGTPRIRFRPLTRLESPRRLEHAARQPLFLRRPALVRNTRSRTKSKTTPAPSFISAPRTTSPASISTAISSANTPAATRLLIST